MDDLGIEPLRLAALKEAVTRWLESQADPRDEVTLVTSSGDLWWSDSAGAGKADLLAVLARVQSRKPAQGSTDYMTDWEAYRIDNYEDATGAREASAGPPGQTAGPPTGPTPSGGFGPANLTGRVAARWQERRGCIGNCRSLVQQRAREIQDRRVRRTRAVFGTVERLSKAMAGARGRKTIVVFSDGLHPGPPARGGRPRGRCRPARQHRRVLRGHAWAGRGARRSASIRPRRRCRVTSA